MNHSELISKTEVFVRERLKDAEGGHDWFHIQRVLNNARLIAKTEEANQLVVDLAALLHDIADSKFHNGDENIGPATARNFLQSLEVDEEIVAHVVSIIENVSFKGGNTARTFSSIELDIVQDADRLDAIGAIGIARTFNYGGHKNRPLYDPAIEPNLNMSKEEYKSSKAPTINHFYEKLLLLKDRMNTETGKRIAAARHDFMVEYLNHFFAEWNGRA